jgi:hypothetical protein
MKAYTERRAITPPIIDLGTRWRWGQVVAQWLRHCAKNRKVAGSIPHGVIGIFH